MKYLVWSKKTTGCEHTGQSLEFALREAQRIAEETKKETLVESYNEQTEITKKIAIFFGHNFKR